MMSFLTGVLVLLLAFIASRYILIPDGWLRRVRIALYSWLSCYTTILLFSNIVWQDDMQWGLTRESVQFWAAMPFFPILFLYSILLDKRFRRFSLNTSSLEQRLGLFGIQLTADLKILWVGEEIEQILGYKDHSLIGKSFHVFVHENSAESIEYLSQYAHGRETVPTVVKVELVYSDGSVGWFTIVAQRHIADSEVITLRCVLQNITATVLQEDRLRLMQYALEQSSIGVTISDAQTRAILYVNQKDATQHGYRRQELIGRDVRIYSPDVLQDNAFPPQECHGYMTLNQHKDETLFPVRIYSSIVPVNNYSQARVAFCQRITEISPYGSILLGEHGFLVCVIDHQDVFVWMNETFAICANIDETRHAYPTVADVFGEETAGLLTECHTPTETIKRYCLPHGTCLLLAAFSGVQYTFLVGRIDVNSKS